jgi:hypothetical protein
VAVRNTPVTTRRHYAEPAVVAPTGIITLLVGASSHRGAPVWCLGCGTSVKNFHRKPIISKPYLRLSICYL